jgi:hypothetical protein
MDIAVSGETRGSCPVGSGIVAITQAHTGQFVSFLPKDKQGAPKLASEELCLHTQCVYAIN